MHTATSKPSTRAVTDAAAVKVNAGPRTPVKYAVEAIGTF
jgi:hypothetical protein